MLSRSVVVVTLLGAISAAAPGARAEVWDFEIGGAHSVAGMISITLESGCPEDYKVPIAGSSTDGKNWIFSLAGVQIPCTPRIGLPITFEGRYSPNSPPCDRVLGTGCPRSVDPDRPGWISVGSLPHNVVLQETTVKYCVTTKCYSGRAFMDRISTPTNLTTAGEPFVGAIAGIGEVTPPGCAPGAMKMPISAVSDGGPLWVVARPGSVAVGCSVPVVGVTNVFIGTWNPSKGGCIQSLTAPGTSMCISSVPFALGPALAGMSLCFPGPSCWVGWASLIRA